MKLTYKLNMHVLHVLPRARVATYILLLVCSYSGPGEYMQLYNIEIKIITVD